jgi:hypothetical protein
MGRIDCVAAGAEDEKQEQDEEKKKDSIVSTLEVEMTATTETDPWIFFLAGVKEMGRHLR